MFTEELRAWGLTPDGAAITTATGTLLPVLSAGRPAMLKRFTDPEEARGVGLLTWWHGEGAVRILAAADDVILMERATGPALSALALAGDDERACGVLCDVAARLHAGRTSPPPPLAPLAPRFDALMRRAESDPRLSPAAAIAAQLLEQPEDIRPLHGDLHHDNVLDFGARGFLAIDPKGLIGPRAFDFANIFCNPDLAHPDQKIARDPARFAGRLSQISRAAKLDPQRLRAWIIAWCGLSAAWYLEDDNRLADIPLEIGRIARQAKG